MIMPGRIFLLIGLEHVTSHSFTNYHKEFVLYTNIFALMYLTKIRAETTLVKYQRSSRSRYTPTLTVITIRITL